MDLNLYEKYVGNDEFFEKKERDLKEKGFGTAETHWNLKIGKIHFV